MPFIKSICRSPACSFSMVYGIFPEAEAGPLASVPVQARLLAEGQVVVEVCCQAQIVLTILATHSGQLQHALTSAD